MAINRFHNVRFRHVTVSATKHDYTGCHLRKISSFLDALLFYSSKKRQWDVNINKKGFLGLEKVLFKIIL